jgi:VWFA-related protein
MRFNKLLRFSLLAFLVVLLWTGYQRALAQAQPDDDVIRVNTDLVVIDAQVLQKKTGRIVSSLRREDFQIYEDGVKQEITFFSQDKLPLSVILLFDLTETVRPVLKPLASGALQALQHLKPVDEVAVMVYAASTIVVQDFTTDRQLITSAIDRAGKMELNEPAFFNEGVFQAAAQSRKATLPSSRRVIIWLTDNQPNLPSGWMRKMTSIPAGELHSEKAAFRELFESDTMVAGLVERSTMSVLVDIFAKKNPAFWPMYKHNPPGDVYKYAKQTGGEVLAANKEEVSRKLAELIDHIRTRYTFGYRPSREQPTGAFCKIKLKIAPSIEKREGKVVIRTRSGYYRGAKRGQTNAPPRPLLQPS